MGCAFATASAVVDQLQSADLVREITGNERNRLYRYEPYVALFQKMTVLETPEATE